MNLLPRRLIFASHILIISIYMYTHVLHIQMLIAVVLHYLIIISDSSCYFAHCRSPTRYKEDHRCVEQGCGRIKWCRMKHCYKCRRCIHRFDHHCVLLDLCIGQFNYRYYFLFLFALLYNTVTIMVNFTIEMRQEVTMNEYGAQHFNLKYYCYGVTLVGVYFNFIMTTYLVTNHSYYIMRNVTTWQYCKRNSISYLHNTVPYPFDKGFVNNIGQIFTTDKGKPIDWAQQLQKH